MAIIGISGSPIVNGNTDRIIKAILKESGRESKFVNLSTLKFFPCRGCAHLCATTAMCGVKDDLHPYIESLRNAEAIVFGSPRQHGNMTAWMFSFFSRLWCFLHENNTLNNKSVVFVATGIRDVAEGRETFRASFVREHKFNLLGEVFYKSFNSPCLKCGMGHYCRNPHGGLWGLLDKNEEKLCNFKFTPDKFTAWEDNSDTVDQVKNYGRILSELG